MAWTNRKSKTYNGVRTTTTVTLGKGITRSNSYGASGFRNTTTQGSTGKIKIVETVRTGGFFQRRNLTVGAKTKKYKMPRGKGLIQTESKILGFFLAVLRGIFGSLR